MKKTTGIKTAILLLVLISGWIEASGQGAAADQFIQMRPKARALFEKWAKQQSAKDGKAVDARGRFLALSVSRRSAFAAITNGLLFTSLTDASGKRLGSAIDLVDSIDSIAGEEEGKGSDEQFRLYVSLKRGALGKLDTSREFVHGKNNTIFHKGFPINYRQKGSVPTLQFSIANDKIKADIDIDYKSSGFPAALFNGHLSAANSDVRSTGNYLTHLRRWPGLVDWWDEVVPDSGFEIALSRTAPSIDSLIPNNSNTAPDSTVVSGLAEKFFKTWLVDKSPDTATTFVSRSLNYCGDLERTNNPTSLAARNRRLFLETLRAANKEVKKANSIKDAMYPVAPVDPFIRAIDHEHKDAFTLAVFTDDDAKHFVCTSKASEMTAANADSRARTYGNHYVTKFRLALDNGKGGILRLMWVRDGRTWKIGAFDAVVA